MTSVSLSKTDDEPTFHYSLTTTKIQVEDGIFKTYGISIEKLQDDNVVNFAEVRDITTDKKQALRCLSMLVSGEVTPYSLNDIIEDFLP